MAHIEWQKGYATGIATIDAQHRQIIEFINRLEDSVIRQEREVVSHILGDLRHYIDSHFRYEEQLIGESGYRFADSHIRAHRRFAERFDAMSQRFEAGAYITRELLYFLRRWLLTHITQEDQGYVEAVSEVLQQSGALVRH